MPNEIPDPSINPSFPDLTDTKIRTEVANVIIPILTNSEISLLFGFQHDSGMGGMHTNVHTRIVLTHSSFIQMMGHLSRHWRYLMEMYGGKPMSLLDVPAEKLQEGLRILAGDVRPGEPDEHNK
jgi:hypothetical protein